VSGEYNGTGLAAAERTQSGTLSFAKAGTAHSRHPSVTDRTNNRRQSVLPIMQPLRADLLMRGTGQPLILPKP
jgi:hypothetical protein